jgi:hypothetical protein
LQLTHERLRLGLFEALTGPQVLGGDGFGNRRQRDAVFRRQGRRKTGLTRRAWIRGADHEHVEQIACHGNQYIGASGRLEVTSFRLVSQNVMTVEKDGQKI